MEERAGPEAHGRRSNHSAELPAIAVKQEPHDEEEEKKNEENRQIVELRQQLEQTEERARIAEEDAVTNYNEWMEWMDKAAEFEAERITVEDDLSNTKNELVKTKKELAQAKKEAEKSSAKLKELCETTKNAQETTADSQRLTDELEETKAKLAEMNVDYERSKVVVSNLQRSLQTMEFKLLEAERIQAAAPSSSPAPLPPTASPEYKRLQWQHEQLLHEHAQCLQAKTAAVAAALAAAEFGVCSECTELKAKLKKSEESLEGARDLYKGLQSTLKAMEVQLNETIKRKTMAEFTALEWKFEQCEKENTILKSVADERKVNESKLESQIDLLKIQLKQAQRAGGSNDEMTEEASKKLDELVKNNEELHKQMDDLRVKAARYADAAHTVTLLERDNADLRSERRERKRKERRGGNGEEGHDGASRNIADLERENDELRRERRERNRAERNEEDRIAKLEKDNAKLEKDNSDIKHRYGELQRRMERDNQEIVANRKKDDHHHDRSRSPPSARSSRADDDDDHNMKRIDDLREIIKRLEKEAADAHEKYGRLEQDRNGLRANLRNKAKVDDEKLFELTNEVERLQSALFHKEAVILDMRKRIDEEQNHSKERSSMMQRIEQMTNQMQEMHEKHDKALAESAAGFQRLKDAYQQLSDDYDEAKEKLVFLSTTSTRQLQEELTQARKKIEQLESDLQALTSKLEKDEETRRKRARFEKDVDEEPVAPAPPFILQQSAFGGASGSFVSPTANEQRWKRGGFQPLGRKDTSHTSAQKNPATNGTTAQSSAFIPRTLR